jgi:hypothetical protein
MERVDWKITLTWILNGKSRLEDNINMDLKLKD